jgi:hypothetical protein
MQENRVVATTPGSSIRCDGRTTRRPSANLAVWLLTMWAFALPHDVDARQTLTGAAPVQDVPLKVFLDCAECDVEYQRQNVTFVDYVRDRAVADLHVLVTTQDTGGGGLLWIVTFIGLGPFLNQDRSFSFATGQKATPDDRRRDFGRVFRIGLAGYAASTPVAPQLDVDWRRPPRAMPRADRWSSWLFRISGTGNVSGEQSTTTRSHRVSVSGNRTTPDWKINITVAGNVDRRRFTVGNDRRVDSRRDSWTLGSQVVKSLGGHAGAGVRASVARSSFSNTDRLTTVASGVEYDVFPYRDASSRSLTVQYTVGASVYDYRDITIFDKLAERVPHHALNVSLGLRAPWGMAGAHSSLSQHLNQRDRHRLSLSASTDVNLFNGFAVNIAAGFDRFNDLISLRQGSASSEEILLRQRQLPTDHSYSFTVGASYSFGSIFNTIVNPRFGGSGGLAIY